jgi:hypothetical protein
MSWLRITRMSRAAGKRAKAALLLGLLLFVLGMVTSATLHKVVHPNANKADHHCAVTLLASGQVDAAPSVVSAATVGQIAIVANRFEVSSVAVASYNLPLSRGPPALLS